jgi:hypothetical protein
VRPKLGLLVLAALISTSAIGQIRAEDALAKARTMTAAERCRSRSSGEIVVCPRDRQREEERYRLPLPDERSTATVRPFRGEVARASIDPAGPRECGPFNGQRRCGKAEALLYGYGGGMDPLSAAIKVGTLLLDPDADVAPTVQVPSRFSNMPH